MKKVFSFILSNIFSLALLGILVCCLLAGHVVLSMFVAVYHGVSILLKEIRDINKGNIASAKAVSRGEALVQLFDILAFDYVDYFYDGDITLDE